MPSSRSWHKCLEVIDVHVACRSCPGGHSDSAAEVRPLLAHRRERPHVRHKDSQLDSFLLRWEEEQRLKVKAEKED